jgi:hypothetical protein
VSGGSDSGVALRAGDAPTSTRDRRGTRLANRGLDIAFAAGALCLAGVVAATLAARATTATGTPVLSPGDWRPTWWTGIILSLAAYMLAVSALALAPSARRKTAIGLAVLIQAVPLATHLFLSTDALSYAYYAKSSDPYAPGGSVYGPVWTAISRVVAQSGHTEFLFRLLAFGSVIAITLMVSSLAERKTLAIAFVGWNPLIAFHFSSAGHNDAVMTALVIGALTLAAGGRVQWAGASWVASVFVKWTSAPIYLLWAIDRRRHGSRAGALGAVASLAVIVAVSYWLFGWTWLHAFSNLRQTERQSSSFFLGWIRDATGIGYPREHELSNAALVVALAAFAVQAWRSHVHLGLAAATLALIAPKINPWYLILAVSLAAADDDDRWGKVLSVVLTAIMFTDVLVGLPD